MAQQSLGMIETKGFAAIVVEAPTPCSRPPT